MTGTGSDRSGDRPGTVVGWREWVALPSWGIPHLKAKVDTGARTSALHAHRLEAIDDGSRVRFVVHPWQGSPDDGMVVEAIVVERRDVRSSSGEVERRPVVRTDLTLAGRTSQVDITLTSRDQMGFRMLIGRAALQGSYLVDPDASYRGGRPSRETRRRNR